MANNDNISAKKFIPFFHDRENYKGRLKTISMFLVVISIFVFLALVTYTKSDEANAQISFLDLFGLITGDEIIKLKAMTTQNLLGLPGAYFADNLYNYTFGYGIIFAPIFVILWSFQIFRNLTISKRLIKASFFYVVFLFAFSTLCSAIKMTNDSSTMVKEWYGIVGMFTSTLLVGYVGTWLTVLISVVMIIVAGIYSFDFNVITIFKSTVSILANSISELKELISKIEFKKVEVRGKREDYAFENSSNSVDVEEFENEIENQELELNEVKTTNTFEKEELEVSNLNENKFTNLKELKSNQQVEFRKPKLTLSMNRFSNIATSYDRFKKEEVIEENTSKVEETIFEHSPSFEDKSNYKQNEGLELVGAYNNEEEYILGAKNGGGITSSTINNNNLITELPEFEDIEFDENYETFYNPEFEKEIEIEKPNLHFVEKSEFESLSKSDVITTSSESNTALLQQNSNFEENDFLSEFNDLFTEITEEKSEIKAENEFEELLSNIESTLIPETQEDSITNNTSTLEEPKAKIESVEKLDEVRITNEYEPAIIPIKNEVVPAFYEAPPVQVNAKQEIEKIALLSNYEQNNYYLDYEMPGNDLLYIQEVQQGITDEEIDFKKGQLIDKLASFKIKISDIIATPGPVVTLFELVPEDNVKVNSILQRENDIALALKAKSIRMIAPVPGRGTIGIEIPNDRPQIVRFSSILNTSEFQNTKAILPLAMGRAVDGSVFIMDLTETPHLLVAGQTGSGKSVGVNAILSSLLYTKQPNEVKFVIIDPKQVEMAQYGLLRNHYLASSPDVEDMIITNSIDSVNILKSLIEEMNLRYTLLADVFARKITDYNDKIDNNRITTQSNKYYHSKLPYIVVIIDEYADLMQSQHGKEIDACVQNLSQKSRAVGIHLVLCTQRPSVNVITGVVKSNFPTRVAYAVAQKNDSRTILDDSGAESLIGRGDMLVLAPSSNKAVRVQNSLITSEETERLAEFIALQAGYEKPYMLPSVVKPEEVNNADLDDIDANDPMLEEIAKFIINTRKSSATAIQTYFSLGFVKANRYLNQLSALGVIGQQIGNKPRTILLDSIAELNRIF